jgi:hypothetical protein
MVAERPIQEISDILIFAVHAVMTKMCFKIYFNFWGGGGGDLTFFCRFECSAEKDPFPQLHFMEKSPKFSQNIESKKSFLVH